MKYIIPEEESPSATLQYGAFLPRVKFWTYCEVDVVQPFFFDPLRDEAFTVLPRSWILV